MSSNHRESFAHQVPRHSRSEQDLRSASADVPPIAARKEGRLRVLLISTTDLGGGAERSAWTLFKAYAAAGHETRLAVGGKRSSDPGVMEIDNESARTGWTRMWRTVAWRLEQGGAGNRAMASLSSLARLLAHPRRWMDSRRGYEDFYFPGTNRLIDDVREADVVHCFNLHGDYFDLRLLSEISRRVPVVLDLRDAWLLSGHCAHSFDCDRWKTGCGACPDLSIPPAVSRDGTAHNWRRKRDIYAQSRLYVAAPSEWLMSRVKQSILAPAIIESRVVPTGIDLTTFRGPDRQAAREALGLPRDPKILLFAANGVRTNVWKDYATLEAAVSLVRKRFTERAVCFVALGDRAQTVEPSNLPVHLVTYQSEPETMARYYQAADLYIHAARADTFPRTVIEALACGTPVVATAVGGIPEQIKGLGSFAGNEAFNTYAPDSATGILVRPSDEQGLAEAIVRLLKNDPVRLQLSRNARNDALQRFDLNLQLERYLDWYRSILRADTRRDAGDLRNRCAN